jgi:hypothetical protein
MTAKKGFSQIPHGFHKRINELNESQLKVWLTHRCMEGKEGTSYPGLDTLVQYTGLNIHTVTNARKWLRDNGWLVSTGQVRGKRGKFSVPIEHTAVPPTAASGNPTNGEASTHATVGGIPTSGTVGMLTASRSAASRATACGSTASGNPTTEVDPDSGSRPTVFEVDPTIELHPSNPPTETASDGRKDGGRNLSAADATAAGKEELILSEEVMLERLQKTQKKSLSEWVELTQNEIDGIPVTPNLTGCKELLAELHKRGITHVDQMNLVCAAYDSWLCCKYFLSFQDREEAKDRAYDQGWNASNNNEVVSRPIYVPEPIRCPLAMFRKEIGVYLDEAREHQDEWEAEPSGGR